MALNQWWSAFTGYLSIEIEGEALEPFINMAMTRGILFWDVHRLDANRMQARVRISGFFGLHQIARRTRCRVRILSRHGWPFFMEKVKKRKMLVIGGLLFLAILYSLASYVWVIRVTGAESIAIGEVYQSAEKHGLHSGVLRRNLDKNLLEKQLQADFPGVAFIHIAVKGSVVEIEIVEKILPPDNTEQKIPGHLVAQRDGIIEDVVVLTGTPKVQVGDTVQSGQILISGIVQTPSSEQPIGSPNAGEIPAPILEEKQVHARGLVRARVWYEGFGDAYLIEMSEQDSGEISQQYAIYIQGKELILWGPKSQPYESCRQEYAENVWGIPWWSAGAFTKVPFTFRTRTFYEIQQEQVVLGPERAIALAKERAERQIEPLRLPESNILQQSVDLVPTDDQNLVRVRVRLETLENIGLEKKLP